MTLGGNVQNAADAAMINALYGLSCSSGQVLTTAGTGAISCTAGGGSAAPAGQVAAFNLAACPSGWVAADGNNGTRNLGGRVVVSVGTVTAGGTATYTLGATGGENTHTLTTAEIPSHSHSGGSSYTLIHSEGNRAFYYSAIGLNSTSGVLMGTLTPGGAATGGGGVHENRPPYMALLWCQKT